MHFYLSIHLSGMASYSMELIIISEEDEEEESGYFGYSGYCWLAGRDWDKAAAAGVCFVPQTLARAGGYFKRTWGSLLLPSSSAKKYFCISSFGTATSTVPATVAAAASPARVVVCDGRTLRRFEDDE